LPPIETESTIRAVLVVLAVLAYYGLVVQRVGDSWVRLVFPRVMDRLPTASSYSADELESIVRMSMAGVMQLAFCAAIILLGGIELQQLFSGRVDPVLVVYGVLLGIGEAALGSYLGYVGMQTAMKVAPARVPGQVSAWLTMSKGGWVRLYMKTAAAAPAWLAILTAVLYISVEEVVFRGVLITSLDGAGAAVALGVSTGLFVVVQVFNMPSWHGAMFPVLGALVIGLVHGAVYLAVPDLLPLIVAHLVAFGLAIL
jgi:membrane protease YdiL (CAAX protease family)